MIFDVWEKTGGQRFGGRGWGWGATGDVEKEPAATAAAALEADPVVDLSMCATWMSAAEEIASRAWQRGTRRPCKTPGSGQDEIDVRGPEDKLRWVQHAFLNR